jgi:hypothetical protein
MIKNYNLTKTEIITIVVVITSISILFSLTTISTIEPTYANHTETHLNNSIVDVTISSDDDIPAALLDDIKRNIARDMEVKEKKLFERNNNNSESQTTNVSSKIANGKIILTSHKYSKTPEDEVFDELPGQVKNTGNGTAEDVSIIFTYYDSSSNAIGNDITKIYADVLQPGQKSSFLGWREISKTPDMAYYDLSVSWYNSDGTQEYIQDVNVTKDPQEKIPIIEKVMEQKNSESESIPFFNTGENEDPSKLSDDDEDDEDDEDEDKNDKKNKNEKKNDEDDEDEDD